MRNKQLKSESIGTQCIPNIVTPRKQVTQDNKTIKSAVLGLSLIILGAATSHAASGSTIGKVVGVDVFDSQRARYTLKKSDGNAVAFWIRLDSGTGNAMLSTLLLAASMGNTVQAWYANDVVESFGGQSAINTNIVFQYIPN